MQALNHRMFQDAEDPDLSDYLASCEAYFLRQLLVYENWPQEKYGELGYTGEKVFVDRNA